MPAPQAPIRTPLQDLKRYLAKTEGTPFFMEEVVQELVEQGVLSARRRRGTACCAPTSQLRLHIPTTVQGVLAARIDRLAPEEKTLLQQLAVIGREFPAEPGPPGDRPAGRRTLSPPRLAPAQRVSL